MLVHKYLTTWVSGAIPGFSVTYVEFTGAKFVRSLTGSLSSGFPAPSAKPITPNSNFKARGFTESVQVLPQVM